MRQAKKQHVTGLKFRQGTELQGTGPAQIGMRLMNCLAGEAFGGDLTDVTLSMSQQQSKEFSAGIAGSANNRDTNHGRWLKTKSTT